MDDPTLVEFGLDRPGRAIDAVWVEAGEPGAADLPWEDAREELVDGLDRHVMDRIRANVLGDAPTERRVGRFRLSRTLGRGGMGTVYAAYDDELRREVAIKLLRSDTCADEDAQHRLIREAQAQAGLSHPHLVPVFEVGRFEDQIYLAMELVDGVTMLEWIARHRPSPRRIVSQWLDVARALVMVHGEGLVHRDIKPANVLVGRDGRARLVDFGLVRGQSWSADVRATLQSGERPSDTMPSPLDQAVTQSRALVGTPVYMAPEVLRGGNAGPRSDQYSLCVSLYESLDGSRPFGSKPRLFADEPLARGSLPRSVHSVLRRGLSFDPDERFGSIEALIAALEPYVDRRRQRRWVVGGGLLGAVTAGALSVWAVTPEPAAVSDPCEGVEAALDSVWNDGSRERLDGNLRATQVPYAASMGEWMGAGVDDFAERWRKTRRGVCEDREIERALSDSAADRAMACLDDQHRALVALLAATEGVQAEHMPNLVAGFGALGAPEECALRALLQTSVEPPPEAIRERVDALGDQVQQVRVHALLEGRNEYVDQARRLYAEAVTIRYCPLVARTSLVLGQVLLDAEDPRARDRLEHAANEAERCGDLGIREKALSDLVRYALSLELDSVEARRALDRDLAVLARIGDPPRRYTTALFYRAFLATMEGSYDAAERDLRASLKVSAEMGPTAALQQVMVQHQLGLLLAGRGRAEEAAGAFAAADKLAATMGVPTSIATAGSLLRGRGEFLRGLSEIEAGNLVEAADWLDRAAAHTRQAYGDDSIPMARVHVAQAKLAMGLGRIDDVIKHAEVADASVRRWLGDDHALRMDALSALGTAAFHRGDAQASVAAFRQALHVAESSLPLASTMVAIHRSNLGEALVLAGDDAQALAHLEVALDSMHKSLPEFDPMIALPSQGLAEIAWRGRDVEQAALHAERALKIREHHNNDPPELARTRWLLARIEASREHHERAEQLANAARAGFESLGPAFAESVQEIDDWLQAQP